MCSKITARWLKCIARNIGGCKMAAAIHRYKCSVCLRQFRQPVNALLHFCWSVGDIMASESARTSLKSYEAAARGAVATSEKSHKAALFVLNQVKAKKVPAADKARVRAEVENANLTALKAADKVQTIGSQVGRMARAADCQSRRKAAAEAADRIDSLAKQAVGYVNGIQEIVASMDGYFKQKDAEIELDLDVVVDRPAAARAVRPAAIPQAAMSKKKDSDCFMM